MRAFVPTREQKSFVALMAGVKLNWNRIASVVINPRTQKPISLETLAKAFKDELATAKTRLQSTVMSKYYEALTNGEPWAIQFGLRHFLGFRNDDMAVSIGSGDETTSDAESHGIKVTFVKASWREDARGLWHDGKLIEPADPPKPVIEAWPIPTLKGPGRPQ
jgi:hypothetical protein